MEIEYYLPNSGSFRYRLHSDYPMLPEDGGFHRYHIAVSEDIYPNGYNNVRPYFAHRPFCNLSATCWIKVDRLPKGAFLCKSCEKRWSQIEHEFPGLFIK